MRALGGAAAAALWESLGGNGRMLPAHSQQSPSGGCSPCMAELLLHGEPPRMQPLPLFVCALPIPRRPRCLQKVKLNVWKEQISAETGPFMLSDGKFRAEY